MIKTRYALLIAHSLFFLVLCGCSDNKGKLHIMEANFLVSQGKFSEAIYAYTKALEYEEAAPYAQYGLGSVYLAMGEEKAASVRFTEAQGLLVNIPSGLDRELRYRVHYNAGVVQFSEKDFSGAADSFREALKIDGRKLEAKRNLELSIMSDERQHINVGSSRESESRTAMFDYIRQKELAQWLNREWLPEEYTAGPDY
jgi:Ca-activated chloride channel family protein